MPQSASSTLAADLLSAPWRRTFSMAPTRRQYAKPALVGALWLVHSWRSILRRVATELAESLVRNLPAVDRLRSHTRLRLNRHPLVFACIPLMVTRRTGGGACNGVDIAVSPMLPFSLLPASLVIAEVGCTSQMSAEPALSAAVHASSVNLHACACMVTRCTGEGACNGVDIAVSSLLPFFLLLVSLVIAEVGCTSQMSAEPDLDACSILASGGRFSARYLAAESSTAPFHEHCSWLGALADSSKGFPSNSLLSGGTPHFAGFKS